MLLIDFLDQLGLRHLICIFASYPLIRCNGQYLEIHPKATAQNLSGQASIIDGDTLEIHGTRIRLWGIDAPESNQLCRGRTSVNAPCAAAKGDEIVTSGSRSDRGKLGRRAMRQARRLDPRIRMTRIVITAQTSVTFQTHDLRKAVPMVRRLDKATKRRVCVAANGSTKCSQTGSRVLNAPNAEQ